MKRVALLLGIILNTQYSSPLFSSGTSSDMPGLTESTESVEQKTSKGFNFLQTKFPHLEERINEPYTPKAASDKIRTEDEAKGVVEFFVNRIKLSVIDPTLYQEPFPQLTEKERKAIPLRQDAEFRTLEKNHSKEGFFKVFFQQTFKNHNCLEEILLAAEYMYETIKSKKDENCTVLFLGRSACLLQKAYELILAATGNTQQHIKHVNFSGHPNAHTLRAEDQYHTDEFKLRNVVTPDRLSHYFDYLGTKNLLTANRIYIVDVLGFGNGLNSFLNILNAYFAHHKTPTPKLDFMMISDIIKDGNYKHIKSFTLVHEGDYCDNNKTLTFKENSNKNITPLTIETHIVPCREYVTRFIFDSEPYQVNLYHGIDYPAQRWSPAHDQARSKGAPYSFLLYPWLTQKMQAILNIHMKIAGM